MGTNALVNVIYKEETITTLYVDASGYPRGLGAAIKTCLEKCIDCNDQVFNEIRRNILREDVEEYRNMPFMEFLKVKIPDTDNIINNIVCNKVVRDERNMAVRLMAGIFNECNNDGYPNTVAIYTRNDPENVSFHYNITLRKFRDVRRPYMTIDSGFKGERIYDGFIDDFILPDEAPGESVEYKFE